MKDLVLNGFQQQRVKNMQILSQKTVEWYWNNFNIHCPYFMSIDLVFYSFGSNKSKLFL